MRTFKAATVLGTPVVVCPYMESLKVIFRSLEIHRWMDIDVVALCMDKNWVFPLWLDAYIERQVERYDRHRQSDIRYLKAAKPFLPVTWLCYLALIQVFHASFASLTMTSARPVPL
jgi:hypothetical protein